MSIPSMIMFEEIKREGFRETVCKNAFGELVIGYGHRIIGSSLFVSKILAKKVGKKIFTKFNELDKERKEARALQYIKKQENLEKVIHTFLLELDLHITEEQGKELLVSDILCYVDNLSSYSKAFRHLRRACKNGVMYSNGQLGLYYQDLVHSEKERKLDELGVLSSQISESEAALVRLDVLVYLLHAIGGKRFYSMDKVFESICINNFGDAAAYMLGHKWGEILKEKAVICALRMKHGRIVRDVMLDCPLELQEEHKFIKRYNKKYAEFGYDMGEDFSSYFYEIDEEKDEDDDRGWCDDWRDEQGLENTELKRNAHNNLNEYINFDDLNAVGHDSENVYKDIYLEDFMMGVDVCEAVD